MCNPAHIACPDGPSARSITPSRRTSKARNTRVQPPSNSRPSSNRTFHSSSSLNPGTRRIRRSPLNRHWLPSLGRNDPVRAALCGGPHSIHLTQPADPLNGTVVHGVSLHTELELLVRAGLSPSQALTAATAVAARAFGLRDRGRIRAGLSADLVLVCGNPTAEITAIRDILRVWRSGVELTRSAIPNQVRAR